ncbi:MAG TPA: DUF4012 domain-containing protein [Ktedonobacteraceae bacterium]|nr:DUF4012 domain-containing protein [Ktedonobacteraceae bacterium]
MSGSSKRKRLLKQATLADVDTVTQPAVMPEHTSPTDIAHANTVPTEALQPEEPDKQAIDQLETAPHIPAQIKHKRTVIGAMIPALSRERYTPTKLLLIGLLLILLSPLWAVIGDSINLYTMYSRAHNGVEHLLNVKSIFLGPGTHLTGFLDASKLHQAQQEFLAAHGDFEQLHTMLAHDAVMGAAGRIWSVQLTSAYALSKIGVDVANIGQELTNTALALAPTFRGPLLTQTQKPLVTPAMLERIGMSVDRLMPYLSDIQVQSRSLSLDSLPISDAQRQQLTTLLQFIPQARLDITQGRQLLQAVGWILGVGEPRTFLVQTMDRAELRPTGGFTGQFGELLINGGRIAPFALKNIGPYEEQNPNSPANGQLAPEPYRSWWPIPNWGVRDANLSADFPTSAQIAIKTYKYEFGHNVDGVILFSPFLITRVLQITGSISIPEYHETITAQNLEERLHYYQLDNLGIRKEEIIEHVDGPDAPTLARKLFTARLSRILQDHVRQAPPDELLAIAHTMLYALKTRDLQIYVTNPQIEALLAQFGAAGMMDRSANHDGLYVVQANLSANKASQYVQTQIHDVVTLNAAGGATHVMQLRLIYNQIGPVYGLDTYRDYVRVYVPSGSRFLWGDGFDAGLPYCGAGYKECPQYDVYQNGALFCPTGVTDAGAATPMLNDPYYHAWHPLDQIGPPTNFASDEPGRTMFGGWVVVPKNCTMTVTLSWYVPPMKHAPYSLLVQRQASTLPQLDLTILPTPGDCAALATSGLHFSGIMDGLDLSFALPNHAPGQAGKSCYPQPPL